MPPHESPHPGVPGAPGIDIPTAGAAASALQDVETARTRARLRAGLTPGWLGPALAVALVLPQFGAAWSDGKKGAPVLISLMISIIGLGVVYVLVRAGKRSSGVLVDGTPRERPRAGRAGLLLVALACALTWVICSHVGIGTVAARFAVFTVGGLGVWATLIRRNVVLRRRLRELT